uniref:Endoglucanase n=1 Tax=Phallusia mammillata TaxID=59560 RepID=A0A6F9DIU5_9ASCI|nr:uncharacterized protein LOC100184662 [Phallusia mammillata]
MRSKVLTLIVLLITLTKQGSGQFFQVGKCGLLTPPRNGMIRRCTSGSRSGSVCTLTCLSGFTKTTVDRTCTCVGGICVWEGVNPKCTKAECPRPDHEDGRIIIVDKWPTGFAGLIEFGEMESDFREGWSVVIAFNGPLGQTAKLKSWTAELAGISPKRDAFTLNNAPFNQNNTDANIKALFVVDHVQGPIPEKGYAGLYNRRIADANCFPKTTLGHLHTFSSYSATPPRATTTTEATTTTTIQTTAETTQTTTVESTTTPPASISSTTGVAVEPQEGSSEETTPSSKLSPSTDIVSTVQPTTQENLSSVVSSAGTSPTTQSTLVTTAAETTALGVTERQFIVENRQCRKQGPDGYRTQPGWIDKEKPYFSGNAIVQVSETIDDWLVIVVYQMPIESIKMWNVVQAGVEENGHVWMFGPMQWNPQLHKGELNINFIAELRTRSDVNPQGKVYLCSTQILHGDPVLLFNEESFLSVPPAPAEAEAGIDESSSQASTSEQPSATSSSVTLAPVTGTTSNPTHDQRCRSSAPDGRLPRQPRQTRPRWKKSKDKTTYDYNEVLHKSILFYEAQRAGPLPPNYNRIPWRGDSTLKDGCSIGADLSGGWFDAGDHVKFTFPMAFSVTMLSWGGNLFRKAYADAGVLTRLLGGIKWPVNYLMRAHVSKFELVTQVGNGEDDHEIWGRPEQLTGARPIYSITKTLPGSEVAAETAAALAAASIFLRRTHRRIAIQAIRHAKELYEFATKYRGHYHISTPEVTEFYRSHSGYEDELIWAGAWLYKATKIKKYLEDAKQNFVRIGAGYQTPGEFSWDHKLVGAKVLLAEITGEAVYRTGIERYMTRMMTAVPKTPQGLVWPNEWAPNRYTANAAMIGLAASMLDPPMPKKSAYIEFAKKQLHLMLGDSGKSYVVGFGTNYPRRVHHRSSSCPPLPGACNWNTYHSVRPNHYILYGALVGGPNLRGVFLDHRSNHRQSEVACDYNAGFQSAIAGLKHYVMQNRTQTP